MLFQVGKECVWCWPGVEPPTEDRYLLPYSRGQLDTNYPLCSRAFVDDEILYPTSCGFEYDPDPYSDTEWFRCEWPENGPIVRSLLGGEGGVAAEPPGPLGEWRVQFWQPVPGMPVSYAEARWVVAEDCSAYEFVPEPGSILLLGSGLTGLAGYAGLRWRRRE